MKAIGIIFSLMLGMNAVAQTNLTPAHIVTQKGDTIHGQAEKRTEARNSRQCVFVAEGSSAAVTYRPGEIACYRYEDDGRLYVSKEVELFGKTERVFVEQLIRGKVSLCMTSSKLGQERFSSLKIKRGNRWSTM